jgi:hypothetical protein
MMQNSEESLPSEYQVSVTRGLHHISELFFAALISTKRSIANQTSLKELNFVTMSRNPQSLNYLRHLFTTTTSQPIMLRTLLRQPLRQHQPTTTTTTRNFITSRLSPSSRRVTFPRWRNNNAGARRHESNLNPPPGTKVHYQPPPSTPKTLSLSERMKAMSKKYGWTVVGIYLGLSALDFPFCFLAVRWFGPERIGHLEHVIVSHVWGALESVIPGLKEKRLENERLALEQGGTAGEVIGKVKEEVGKVEGKQEGSASKFSSSFPLTVQIGEKGTAREDLSLTVCSVTGIWTQLLIAYGVHKSLFFIRIPITLAITPKVVKTLRGWGWKIGNVTPKA